MARRGTAETEVKTIISGKDNSKKAFRSLQNSLKNTSRTLQVVQGPLGPVAGRFTALSGAMGSVSLRAVSVTAAFVGLTVALGKGLKTYAQTEKQLGQIQAQLTATGFAAGKSAAEMESMAQAVARATLASLTEVRTAQGILLSFRSITEDSFDAALRASQDLAAAGFGSITDAAKQLGKALEDPVTGLSSLRRAGVTFSSSQKQVIKDLVETGNKAEAMAMILEGINSQVGGAGVGAGKGLAGAFDSLSQSVENFWTAVGDTAVASTTMDIINNLADSIQRLSDMMSDLDDLSIQSLSREYQNQLTIVTNLGAQLQKMRQAAGDSPSNRQSANISRQRGRVDAERAILQTLEDQLKARQKNNEVADEKGRAAQEELAQEERITAAKKRQLELDKEIAAWQRNAEKDLQKLVAQEQKRAAALRGVLASLDPIGEINRQFAADQRILNEGIENEVELKKLLLILDRQRLEAIDAVINKEQELTDSQKKIKEGAESIARIMGDGFKAATLEGKKFGDVMGDMLKRIAEQLVEILVIQRLVQGISGGIQGAFAGAGGATAAPIVERGVPISPNAAIGGMRSGRTLVGESGPEVVDLPRGSRVTSNRQLRGDMNVTINNTIPDAEVETQQQPDGSLLINFIEKTVNNSLAGGSIGRNIQQQFGSQRQPVRR